MTYFLKRAAFLLPLLLLISVLAFALLKLAPGGPFDKERAPATAESKATPTAAEAASRVSSAAARGTTATTACCARPSRSSCGPGSAAPRCCSES